jgi:hypothetical protein
MLATLKKFDRPARQGILASYVHDLLPDPGVDAQSKHRRYPEEVYLSLRADIAKALRLGPEDTPEVRHKILNFLSEQIRINLVDTKKIGDVRARVGHKGALPLSDYELKFTKNFVELNETLGVSRSMVRAAFKDPDSVEHLALDLQIADFAPVPSVITKTFRGKNPYVLLIIGMREKAVLSVDGAWIIHHADVDLSGAENAVEVLRRFVEAYGVKCEFWDSQDKLSGKQDSIQKLVLNEQFAVRPYVPRHFRVRVIDPPQEVEIDAKFQWSVTVGSLSIAYAFVLNITAYTKALRMHGVEISRVPTKNGRFHQNTYVLEIVKEPVSA